MNISYKNYNEDSERRYVLDVDVEYPEALHEIHNNVSFLPERRKTGKFETLVTNLHDKKEYFYIYKI